MEIRNEKGILQLCRVGEDKTTVIESQCSGSSGYKGLARQSQISLNCGSPIYQLKHDTNLFGKHEPTQITGYSYSVNPGS